MKKHEQHLTKRDKELLKFVARYRIGTEDMFRQLFFARDKGQENVARVLRRLERRRWLQIIKYGTGFSYVVLTRRGLSILGLEPRTPRSLTEQSLPVVLAIAVYCTGNGLQRLTNHEFCELYPELWRPGLRSSNYVLVETSTGPKLEMLMVDRGGAARRIGSRIRRVIAQRQGLADFLSLMQAGRFRVNILTGVLEQQEKIRKQVERESFDLVEVTTTLAPELGELLMLRR